MASEELVYSGAATNDYFHNQLICWLIFDFLINHLVYKRSEKPRKKHITIF